MQDLQTMRVLVDCKVLTKFLLTLIQMFNFFLSPTFFEKRKEGVSALGTIYFALPCQCKGAKMLNVSQCFIESKFKELIPSSWFLFSP